MRMLGRKRNLNVCRYGCCDSEKTLRHIQTRLGRAREKLQWKREARKEF
jgi:hypothetical protein